MRKKKKKQESVNILENVNAEDEINETTDEELQTIKQADQEEIEDRNESAIAVAYSNKDEGLEENNDGDESDKAVLASPEDYQNIDKSSFEEDLSEETALKEDLEENLQAKEEIEISIKEKVLETDTSSIDISSSEAIKKKEELQSLEALFDDEALNTDGRNPVNSISEEPISIYRQYSRPAIVTALLFFSNALLIIALGAQYAWANFDIYLRESRFSNITGFVCNYANCPDVRRFDLSAFATDQLIVNSHPTISNALQIDFIFRNTAEFEQQFPIVELNFSDLNRRLLANRLFQPEEYLEQDLQQFNYLPPNSSIQIRLEIADPGPEAINYSLSLRTP